MSATPPPNDQPDSAPANVESLLSRMSSADHPDPQFVVQLQTELCREAKRLAASRSVGLAAPSRFRWQRVLQTTAVAAVFVLGFWLGIQQSDTDIPATPIAASEHTHTALPDQPDVTTAPITVPVAATSPIAFHRQLATVGPENAVCLSYDDLVPRPQTDAIECLEPLSGRRVRIRGFMRPSFVETDLTGFWLARDNQFCCFGPNPKQGDIIHVTLRDGSTTDYIEGRPFDVVGILTIDSDATDSVPELLSLNDAIVVSR